MKKLAIVVLLFVTAGCGWSGVRYTPVTKHDVPVMTKRLERLLWEQFQGYAPKAVEVTNEYFSANKDSVVSRRRGLVTTAMTTVESGTRYYFTSVGRVEIAKKRSLYLVILRDKAGAEMYRYYTTLIDNATEFADLVVSLRDSDSNASPVKRQ